MHRFIKYISILFLLFSFSVKAQRVAEGTQVAFLADVHLQDLYGKLEDSDYKGIVNPKNGRYTLLRTMDAQLRSTRIFNENYFAFLAALDDIAKRGIRYVALPGDYTDDGQPLHVRGLQRILREYKEKYGINFFITTGNHDPVGPFAQEAGKNDFLGESGKRQPIYSKEGLYVPDANKELPVVLSPDIAKMGYSGITKDLDEFGFFPQQGYVYWATPFSTYNSLDYTFDKAKQVAALEKRTYEVAPGYTVPDASYLVEPAKGLWLLAIDGNVYIPKANSDANSLDSKNYGQADLGYNNVLSHKKYLIDWVRKVSEEAEKQGKVLIAFSHYPMIEFNDGASGEIEKLMGPGKWQLNRVPKEEVAQAFADAGIKVHFGGHMHINDTGIRRTAKGNTLVNIQTPSLAAYIPAYKLLTIKKDQLLEVETITIDQVPRFNELFELYKMEHAFLKKQGDKEIWNEAILKTKSYHEFTDYHLKELIRLRFLPSDWPESFKDFILGTSGDELLILANIKTEKSFDQILKEKNRLKEEFSNAEINAKKALSNTHLKLSDFKKWNGFDLIRDFYRIRSADQLAIKDIGLQRIKEYQLISKCFFENYHDSINDPTQEKLALFLTILDKFLKGAPADHFQIDLKNGSLKDLKK